MINRRILFLAGLTALCAACGPSTPPKSSSVIIRDQAIGLINKNDFQIAKALLWQSLSLDPYNAKANYALAICYLRGNPPDRDNAMRYRNRARELGYAVPAWFDNALNPKPKAKEKKAKKRKAVQVNGKVR
jgi:Flp pilus assembly protein TadD